MAELGLALGGGGARGLAHIGVLKVLEKEKIDIHAITGCSMGAVIGSLYTYYGSAEKVEDLMLDFIDKVDLEELGIPNNEEQKDASFWDEFVSEMKFRYQVVRSLQDLSLISEEHATKIFELIPDVEISSLTPKFSAIATDLLSGNEINIRNGNLRSAVKASSAIPGIFPPVRRDGMYFVDGSASESVPAGKVRELGADRVLAVDVSHELKTEEEPKNVLEILYRTEDISSYHLSMERLKEADLVISPDVHGYTWAEFKKAKTIIAEGENAAKENLSEIQRLMERYTITLELEQLLKKFKS
jgi:NTE family protein